jgi:preprotein translocase subunit SecE
MENNNGKIVTVSFMIAGALVGIVIMSLMGPLSAATSGSLARTLSSDYVRHGVPVAIAILLFLSLQFNRTVAEWADEVVAEIKKVVWPSRKDTSNMTIVVCIMLLISGLVLGVLDFASGTFIDWVLHLNFRSIF